MANTSRIQELSFITGQRILCSSGRYSDYRVHGCYDVLKSFNTEVAQTFWASGHVDTVDDVPCPVLQFLVTHGYLRSVPMDELYLGEYGQHVFMRRDTA